MHSFGTTRKGTKFNTYFPVIATQIQSSVIDKPLLTRSEVLDRSSIRQIIKSMSEAMKNHKSSMQAIIKTLKAVKQTANERKRVYKRRQSKLNVNASLLTAAELATMQQMLGQKQAVQKKMQEIKDASSQKIQVVNDIPLQDKVKVIKQLSDAGMTVENAQNIVFNQPKFGDGTNLKDQPSKIQQLLMASGMPVAQTKNISANDT